MIIKSIQLLIYFLYLQQNQSWLKKYALNAQIMLCLLYMTFLYLKTLLNPQKKCATAIKFSFLLSLICIKDALKIISTHKKNFFFLQVSNYLFLARFLIIYYYTITFTGWDMVIQNISGTYKNSFYTAEIEKNTNII